MNMLLATYKLQIPIPYLISNFHGLNLQFLKIAD